MAELLGSQIGRLQDALLDAFPSHSLLSQLVRIQLNENLDAVAGGESLSTVTFNLIVWAARNGRFNQLLDGALEANPGNVRLLQAVNQLRVELGALQDGQILDLPDVPEPPRPVSRWLVYGSATALGVILLLLAVSYSPLMTILGAVTAPTATPTFTPTPTATTTPAPTATPTLTPTPIKMTGPIFNIAVADFGELGSSGETQGSALGSDLSRLIFNELSEQIRNSDLIERLPSLAPGDIQVWHLADVKEQIRQERLWIRGETPTERGKNAATLAQNINADMVIYGHLRVADNPSTLELEFYYDYPQLGEQPDAIGGRTQLARPLVYKNTDPQSITFELKDQLGLRSNILYWLTIGMAHDIQGKEAQALELFLEADAELAKWPESDGKELLYYLIGRSYLYLRNYTEAERYFDLALDLEPGYANALMGKGSIYFDRAQLYAAGQVELPPGVQQCTSQEQVEAVRSTVDDPVAEVNRATDLFAKAVDAAPDAEWPPIEAIAQLNYGLGKYLQGQYEPDEERAKEDIRAALDVMQQTVPVFEEHQQVELLGHAYLSLGNAHLALGNLLLREGEQREARDTIGEALNFYSQCRNLRDNERASIWFEQKIVECGCEPYFDVSEKALVDLAGGNRE